MYRMGMTILAIAALSLAGCGQTTESTVDPAATTPASTSPGTRQPNHVTPGSRAFRASSLMSSSEKTIRRIGSTA